MLYFNKENTVSRKNKCQGIFPTDILSSLVNIYSFGAWCIYEWYRRNDMSTYKILYSTTA